MHHHNTVVSAILVADSQCGGKERVGDVTQPEDSGGSQSRKTGGRSEPNHLKNAHCHMMVAIPHGEVL